MPKRNDEADKLAEFVRLMTEHQGNLRAFIISLIPGSPDVADIQQETNAVVWSKRDRFKHGTNFIAWVFQIARYEVLRHRERQRSCGNVMFSAETVELLADMEHPDDASGELLDALDHCLDKLDKSQQELIRERYTPGHSLEDLAARTGRSAGSLRIALLRIREILRRCVEDTLANRST